MAKRVLFLFLFLILFASVASAQQFYQWKDRKGLWNLSNNRPAGVTEEMGSDAPPLAPLLPKAVKLVEELPISEEDKEKIFHKNSARLLKAE